MDPASSIGTIFPTASRTFQVEFIAVVPRRHKTTTGRQARLDLHRVRPQDVTSRLIAVALLASPG